MRVRTVPLSTLRISIDAPGTIAPEGSDTMPCRLAPTVWARAVPDKIQQTSTARWKSFMALEPPYRDVAWRWPLGRVYCRVAPAASLRVQRRGREEARQAALTGFTPRRKPPFIICSRCFREESDCTVGWSALLGSAERTAMLVLKHDYRRERATARSVE